eukprot:scaffold3100_cov403-Prasinococcus_capsulatus_cf.AAC.11
MVHHSHVRDALPRLHNAAGHKRPGKQQATPSPMMYEVSFKRGAVPLAAPHDAPHTFIDHDQERVSVPRLPTYPREVLLQTLVVLLGYVLDAGPRHGHEGLQRGMPPRAVTAACVLAEYETNPLAIRLARYPCLIHYVGSLGQRFEACTLGVHLRQRTQRAPSHAGSIFVGCALHEDCDVMEVFIVLRDVYHVGTGRLLPDTYAGHAHPALRVHKYLVPTAIEPGHPANTLITYSDGDPDAEVSR